MATTATVPDNAPKVKASEVEREIHQPTVAGVQEGHIMAFTYWARVLSKNPYGPADIKVVNLDNGQEFRVQGDGLVTAATSADQFEQTREVSMTRAAQLLVDSKKVPFTVCFTKQDGTERVLRGRLVGTEPLLGRSYVEDLEIPFSDKGGRFRLVDHRTLRWLTVEGTKYVVK
jgi:hypothetical protein